MTVRTETAVTRTGRVRRTRALSWWAGRTTREQRLLLAMAAILGATLIWYGIIRPLDDALADARARHTRAITAEAEARGIADAIADLRRTRPAGLDLPVRVFVPGNATAAGFTVTRADPFEPDGVSIVMASVRPATFFTWLSGLQARGLVVEALSASPNPDRTLSVQFTVRSGTR